MRGSTLLFHSLEALDPVSFDRVEDIEEALEPELTYAEDNNIRDHHYKVSSSSNCSSRYPGKSHPTPRKPLNTEKVPTDKPTRHCSPSRSVPLLDLLNSYSDLQSSSSSPLTKSNYFEDTEFKENQSYDYSLEYRRDSSSSISSGDSGSSTGSLDSQPKTNTTATSIEKVGKKNIMSFHNHSRSDDGRKTFTSIGSGMPLSRLRSERSGGGSSHSFGQGSHNVFDDQSRIMNGGQNENGFTRFFSGLKSNKPERNRFDVNNLPPQLKSELKKIYVY